MTTIHFNETAYEESWQEFGATLAEYEEEGATHEELYDLYKCFAAELDALITDALYAKEEK